MPIRRTVVSIVAVLVFIVCSLLAPVNAESKTKLPTSGVCYEVAQGFYSVCNQAFIQQGTEDKRACNQGAVIIQVMCQNNQIPDFSSASDPCVSSATFLSVVITTACEHVHTESAPRATCTQAGHHLAIARLRWCQETKQAEGAI